MEEEGETSEVKKEVAGLSSSSSSSAAAAAAAAPFAAAVASSMHSASRRRHSGPLLAPRSAAGTVRVASLLAEVAKRRKRPVVEQEATPEGD